MFRGLAALFGSGLIFHPLVLLGIVSGSVEFFKLDNEQIWQLYQNWRFYALVVLAAAIWALTLGRTYQEDGITPDWGHMTGAAAGGAVMLLISNFCVIMFWYLISF